MRGNRDDDPESGPKMPMMRMPGRKRPPFESILSGLAISVAFFLYWRFNPHAWWPIFGILFAGLMPIVRGIRDLIASKAGAPKSARLSGSERVARNERTVLKIAQARAGQLTPSLVVLDSGLSLEEAENVLDSFVRKGHAEMCVLDDGRITYVFSEFLPLP